MFFRFAAALIVVVLISVIGVALEKQTLETKRAISRQYYQKDLLLEIHAKLRLKIQQRTAPAQLAELNSQSPVVVHSPSAWSIKSTPSPDRERESTAAANPPEHRVPVPRLPLLRWAHPADVETSHE